MELSSKLEQLQDAEDNRCTALQPCSKQTIALKMLTCDG